ncbi:hypothetical protein KC315_g56 [Hortaea werneckii]|nr:hypothetical protein KC315_g56 [Hortaea werneckii]
MKDEVICESVSLSERPSTLSFRLQVMRKSSIFFANADGVTFEKSHSLITSLWGFRTPGGCLFVSCHFAQPLPHPPESGTTRRMIDKCRPMDCGHPYHIPMRSASTYAAQALHLQPTRIHTWRRLG